MPGRLEYERAIRRSDLPPPSRHLALTIATWADMDTGVIPEQYQPSMNTLLAATGMSKGSMLNHLGRLETEGWITCDRPSEHDARTRHIRNSYGLAIPGGLGQELTQPRSGADPALGQEMDQGWVRSRPRARSGADPKSPSQSPESPSLSPAEQVVRDSGVVADDERETFINWINNKHQPRSSAWWRKVASNGDLTELAAAWRADQPATASSRTPREGKCGRHPWANEGDCSPCRAAQRERSDPQRSDAADLLNRLRPQPSAQTDSTGATS